MKHKWWTRQRRTRAQQSAGQSAGAGRFSFQAAGPTANPCQVGLVKDCGLPFEPLLLPKTLNGSRTPLQGVVRRKEKPEYHRWGNWIPSRFQP